MEEPNCIPHVNLLHIKSVDITESEVFFDILYKHIGLHTKRLDENGLFYWGPFGIMVTEQKDMLVHLEPYHRLGIVRISIRVGLKKIIDDLFYELKELRYQFAWEPKSSTYAEGYYSVCLKDPDENEFEILYTD
jgi:hypothetical protein